MLSWSDFATLLLAVFAAMYASAEVERTRSAATAQPAAVVRAAPQPASSDTDGGDAAPAPANGADAGADRLAADLVASLAALGLSDRAQVRVDGGTVGIDIDAELLFREGDAALSAGAKELLADVVHVLRDQACAIRVEGHTDDKPIANGRFASNWELSAARAAVVVRQLAAAGIAEARMTAVGMAANQPLVSNASADGRARNRRVHLVLLRPAGA